MRLYPIPGGTWCGTEADWKAAMKAKGLNPKDFEDTKTREVPTGKKELMEFLTFFAVDPYRLAAGTTVSTPAVDVAALRALHNPGAVVEGVIDAGAAIIAANAAIDFDPPKMGDLTAAFEAAPIKLQAELAVGLIDRLTR